MHARVISVARRNPTPEFRTEQKRARQLPMQTIRFLWRRGKTLLDHEPDVLSDAIGDGLVFEIIELRSGRVGGSGVGDKGLGKSEYGVDVSV